jgi:hypothetical protein
LSQQLAQDELVGSYFNAGDKKQVKPYPTSFTKLGKRENELRGNIPEPQPATSPPTPAPSQTPSVTSPPSQPSEEASEPETHIVYVKWPTASLREGPGTNFKVIVEVKKGTSLEVKDDKDQWLLVGLEDGTEGWIGKATTSKTP